MMLFWEHPPAAPVRKQKSARTKAVRASHNVKKAPNRQNASLAVWFFLCKKDKPNNAASKKQNRFILFPPM